MKIQRFTLQTVNFGTLKLLRPVPTEERQGDTLLIDPWGVLATIRDSVPSIARLIPVVTGEAWSHALHGHARPLMLTIGPAPSALLKMATIKECASRDACIMYDAKRCTPNKKLPECWLPDGVEEVARQAVAVVTLAWAENRYVVVVEGAEFRI